MMRARWVAIAVFLAAGFVAAQDQRYGASVQPLRQIAGEERYGGATPQQPQAAGQSAAGPSSTTQRPTSQPSGNSQYGQAYGQALDAASSPGPRTNFGATNNPAASQISSASGLQTTDLVPSELMRQMMTPPSDSQLTGTSMSLAEAVRSAKGRNARALRIDAYWDLCSAAADYYLGLREQKELGKLRQGVSPGNSAVRDAEQLMASRLDTSLKAAVASQLRLADLMGRADRPLPSDPPFCGRYATRYQQIFSGRASTEAAQLDRLIPLRASELDTAAAAVGRAEQWTLRVARQESSSADGILQAMQLMALNRRAFVQIAKDYNRRIARYAELASPEGVAPETLVAMLIETPAGASRANVAGRDTGTPSASPAFRSPLVGQPAAGLR